MIDERKEKCARCNEEFWFLTLVNTVGYCTSCAKIIDKRTKSEHNRRLEKPKNNGQIL
jgi:hypothetical protein